MASILTNTGIASLGRVVIIFLGVGITAALTRFMGVEAYGAFALLLSYGVLFQIAADFGLYLTMTKEIAERGSVQHSYVSHIFILRLVLLVLLLGCALGGAYIMPSIRPYSTAFIIIAVGLVAQSISQLCMGIYQAHGKIWPASVGDVFGRLVQFVGIFLVFWVFLQPAETDRVRVVMYMTTLFSLSTITALIIHWRLLPEKPRISRQVSVSTLKSIVRVSWPLGVMLLLNVVYFRVDMVMLSLFRTAEEVGLYGLAYRIVENLLFFPAMFGGLLLPKLSKALAHVSKEKARALVEEGLRVSLVVSAFLVIALLVFSRQVVVLLSGVAFAEAGPLLQILSVALGSMVVGNMFGFSLVALGKQKALLMLYAALVVFNVVANAVFIPLYGGVAAAFTTVATEFMATTVAAFLVWQSLHYVIRIGFAARLGVVIVVSAVFALLLPAHWHVIVQGVAVIAVFGSMAMLMQIISYNQFPLLMSSKSAASHEVL